MMQHCVLRLLWPAECNLVYHFGYKYFCFNVKFSLKRPRDIFFLSLKIRFLRTYSTEDLNKWVCWHARSCEFALVWFTWREIVLDDLLKQKYWFEVKNIEKWYCFVMVKLKRKWHHFGNFYVGYRKHNESVLFLSRRQYLAYLRDLQFYLLLTHGVSFLFKYLFLSKSICNNFWSRNSNVKYTARFSKTRSLNWWRGGGGCPS